MKKIVKGFYMSNRLINLILKTMKQKYKIILTIEPLYNDGLMRGGYI